MAAATGVSGAPVAFPISKVCPKCGHTEFTRQRPQGWVAFAWDRICSQCGTIYSPPTPTWASIVFIVAGLLLSSFGGIGVVAAVASGNPLSLPAVLCEGFLGVIGLLALIHGIRTLASPPKT